ncbi:MAG TPA: N-acetylmuramoyl-L-alanine amidase [Devosia sp.]|nr:N-acetylmuramoyl-L-alanine amidase [Devosia sp.]
MFNSRGFWRSLAVVVVCLAALPAVAQDLPDVLAARVTSTPERARLILDLSNTTEYAIVSLADPNRIAVDVRAQSVGITTAPPVAGSGMVGSFVTKLAEEGRVRTELVLNVPAVVQQAYALEPVGDQPARLVVDLIPTTAEDFAARTASDLASSIARGAPSGSSPEADAARPSEESSGPPPVAALPGGSRPLVVIDPGHGGFDSGAEAPGGIREKDITLAFALRLRDTLVASGLFDVALTRDDDTYLTLNQRVDLARENKADLFLSLHADTFQEATIRGASIYTRDERASDVLDAVLAEGENRRDVVAGFVLPEAKPVVADILLDLMRRQMRQQSFMAASAIVKAMEPSITMRRFPVRQADFFVLQAPDVPSLLVELGFLSNAKDITNLESDSWRDEVVAAIAKGIADYFAEVGKPE